MPDKKLTDKEIVKACKDCLHYEACKGTYSSAKGDEDILYDFDGEMYANSGCEDFQDKDLINRQNAEIERLSVLAELGNTRANDYRVMRDRALKAEAENERYEKALRQVLTDIKETKLLVVKDLQSAKAEAYKEFAERLHEELRIYGIKDKFNKSVFLNVADKAKKELVGENDG